MDAAIAAGAEFRDGVSVTGVLREGDLITGVRIKGNGAAYSVKARITVGADGRNSRIAQVVEAPTYNEVPALQGTYFAYWRNLPMPDAEVYIRERRAVYGWETNDGLTLVGVNWSLPDFAEVKRNLSASYIETIEACAPALRARMEAAKQEGAFIGGSVPNFMRKPFGAGWALVGDAGLTMDPCTAAGITNAFRDSELLTEAIDDGLSGRRPLLEALEQYQVRRDATSTPIYEFACQLAPFAPPTPEMAQLLAALTRNQNEANRFIGLFAQTVQPTEFFAPDNLEQIMKSEH